MVAHNPNAGSVGGQEPPGAQGQARLQSKNLSQQQVQYQKSSELSVAGSWPN